MGKLNVASAPVDRVHPVGSIVGHTSPPIRAARILRLDELRQWLTHATPGDSISYFCGYLAMDRGAGSRLGEVAGEELDRVATALMAMAEAGLVHLVQRRNGPNSYTYIVVHARSNRRGSTRSARETVS